MSLTGVKMSEDVWLTCVTHALSTETEEIMGLLLGDIQYLNNGSATALIWGASPQTRSDRRKDRVETNPEQLAAASAQAERMTLATGRTTRVIGWYHSHPHITVLPSHVDVRTQSMYQLLDTGFIGLIFSCFSEDASKVGRIQVIAFQSLDGRQKHTPRPVSVSPVNNSVIEIETSLSPSDSASGRSGSSRVDSLEQDTGDSRAAAGSSKIYGINTLWELLQYCYKSEDVRNQWPVNVEEIKNFRSSEYVYHIFSGLWKRLQNSSIEKGFSNSDVFNCKGGRKAADLEGFFAHADVNYLGKEKTVADFHGDKLQNAVIDIDSMDMTASMQEAMHRSTLDMSGAEYVRKEIHLQVLPTSSLLKLDTPLASFIELQRVLFEEEHAAYNQAILQNMRDGKVHPLAFVHHTSTYQASMCKLMEYCLSPASSVLQDRLRENEIRLAMLTEEAKTLEIETLSGSQSRIESPRNLTAHGFRSGAHMGQRDMYSSAESSKLSRPGGVFSRSRKGS